MEMTEMTTVYTSEEDELYRALVAASGRDPATTPSVMNGGQRTAPESPELLQEQIERGRVAVERMLSLGLPVDADVLEAYGLEPEPKTYASAEEWTSADESLYQQWKAWQR